MKVNDISFSVNAYDSDGDVYDDGIFLHFGDTRVKAADNFDDFRTIVKHMEQIVSEIQEQAGC